MSVIGKGSSSFKKQDVMEQKGIALGFKKIRFAHKATAGDTSINLTTLVTPTEMSSLGFTNPSPTTLVNAQLGIYRNNLKLVSSLRGLLVDQLSYVASSTAITFVGFTAEDGEIFQGWLDEAPTTSLQVVDGATIVASGILAAGQTDFNIGTPITINKNPAQAIGAVMVFADRGLQYRKAGNVATGDGDYIEVPVAGGLGSLIRFNASGSDRFITVMSNGVVSERPDGSMMAAIERVQGQVDAMVPTLAQVAGVPETTFQTAPNDVNLKQFGDQVVANTVKNTEQDSRLSILENNRGNGILVYRTTGQNIPDATPTKVQFNQTGWSNGALASYDAVNFRIILNKPGLWLVGSQLGFATSGTYEKVFQITKNGVSVISNATGGDGFQNIGGRYCYSHSVPVFVASSGEYIEANIAQFSGNPINANEGFDGQHLWAVYLGNQ